MEIIKLYENQQNHLQVIEDQPKHLSHEVFELYPQMPVEQIKHCLKQAYQTQSEIIVQVNPRVQYPKYQEVTGLLKLNADSQNMMIQSPIYDLTYILIPRFIRHIRLASQED